MNANEMAQKFWGRRKTAKEAFNPVIEGLASMDDPVAQSAAGVNNGTMWEDLGPQVITSMSTASDAIDKKQRICRRTGKCKIRHFIRSFRRTLENHTGGCANQLEIN